MTQAAILEAFAELPDPRRGAGQRHTQTLCLALFTKSDCGRQQRVSGNWRLGALLIELPLINLFAPPSCRLPSYSTIRRVLLHLDYQQYSARLARFFGIRPMVGETIAADGKVLRGSYQLEDDNPNSAPDPAIMLVSAYIVERGLILDPERIPGQCRTSSAPALL